LVSCDLATRNKVVRCAAAALEASSDQRAAIEAAALLLSKLARSKELLLEIEALDAVAVLTTALHINTMANEDDLVEQTDRDRRPTIKALALALRSLLRARLCVCARSAAAEAEKIHRAAATEAASGNSPADLALQRSSACGVIFRGDSRYLSLSARSMVENVYVLEACVDNARSDVLRPFRDIVRKAITNKHGVSALIQGIAIASLDRPCDTLIALLECLELFALHPCTSEVFADTFVSVSAPGHFLAQRTMHAAEVLVSASKAAADVPSSAAISAVFCALFGAFQPPLPSSVRSNNARVVDCWGLNARPPGLFVVPKDTFHALVDRILVHSVLPFFISSLDSNQPQQARSNEARHPGDITALNAFVCRAMCALCRSPQVHGLLSASGIRHMLSDMSRDKNTGGSDLVSSYEKQRGGSFERALRAVAQSLLSAMTGRNEESVAKEAACAALDRMDKAAIAESTVIRYDPRELLLLIHQHLLHCGLTQSAASLAEEAGANSYCVTTICLMLIQFAQKSLNLLRNRAVHLSPETIPPFHARSYFSLPAHPAHYASNLVLLGMPATRLRGQELQRHRRGC
jgi:hypothetical protein